MSSTQSAARLDEVRSTLRVSLAGGLKCASPWQTRRFAGRRAARDGRYSRTATRPHRALGAGGRGRARRAGRDRALAAPARSFRRGVRRRRSPQVAGGEPVFGGDLLRRRRRASDADEVADRRVDRHRIALRLGSRDDDAPPECARRWRVPLRHWLQLIAVAIGLWLCLNWSPLLPSTWEYAKTYTTGQQTVHGSLFFMGRIHHNLLEYGLGGTPPWFYAVFTAVKLAPATLLCALVGLGFALVQRRPAHKLMLSWVAIWFLVHSISGSKWGRFFISVLPAFLIFAGAAAAAFIERLRLPAPRWAAAAAAVLLLPGSEALAAIAHAPHYRTYISPLGGGDARLQWYFPHCDYFDARTSGGATGTLDPVASFTLDPLGEFPQARADGRSGAVPEHLARVRHVRAGERDVARLRRLPIEDRPHTERLLEQGHQLGQ